jgi:hypothetical protein
VLILAVERSRLAYLRGEPWTDRLPSRWAHFCTTVPRIRYLWWFGGTTLGVLLAGLSCHTVRLHQLLSDERLAVRKLSDHLAAAEGRLSDRDRFGFPPTPERPHHPKRIAGTYYRGNCERNAALFNNGNYLTAKFHVDLCDDQRNRLDVGNPIPAGGMYVRFALERSPNTTPVLYSPGIIKSVFLSERVLPSPGSEGEPDADRKVEAPIVRLQIVEPDWKWQALVPILPRDPSATRVSGLIYVSKGSPDAMPPTGASHYAIRYDLVIDDGRLSPESDLWMGVLMLNGRLSIPKPGEIPLCEWFDWRDLPEIQGTNPSDPVLLGIPEHVTEQTNPMPDPVP